MKSIFVLLGLTRYTLANLYMSRDERCRKCHPSAGGSFCAPCVNYQYEALLDASA